MGILKGGDILYTMHFADDQLTSAQNEEDVHYMLQKQQKIYKYLRSIITNTANYEERIRSKIIKGRKEGRK